MEKAAVIALPGGKTLKGKLAIVPSATMMALVLHPHPHRGGNMNSHVVTELCSTLQSQGVSTLRFNFRTDAAEGAELLALNAADARAALAHIVAASDTHTHLLLAGYSWGTVVAAHLGTELGAHALGLVSPVLDALEKVGLAQWAGPTMIITGDNDFVCPAQQVFSVRSRGSAPHVVLIPNTDHFWSDRAVLGAAVGQVSRWLVQQGTDAGGGKKPPETEL